MGRIKTKQIKRVTMDLMDAHSQEFSKEFETNRGLVEKFSDIKSKKLRNTIAGYVTRLARTGNWG